MKKRAVILLMISMMSAVSLTACGSKEEAAATESVAEETVAEEAAEDAAEEETE